MWSWDNKTEHLLESDFTAVLEGDWREGRKPCSRSFHTDEHIGDTLFVLWAYITFGSVRPRVTSPISFLWGGFLFFLGLNQAQWQHQFIFYFIFLQPGRSAEAETTVLKFHFPTHVVTTPSNPLWNAGWLIQVPFSHCWKTTSFSAVVTPEEASS